MPPRTITAVNVGSTVRFGLGVADGQIEFDLHSEFSGADAYYGAATAMLFGTVIRTSLRIFAQWPNALVPAGRIVATVEIPEDSTGVGYINWEHCDDPFVAETVDQFIHKETALDVPALRRSVGLGPFSFALE